MSTIDIQKIAELAKLTFSDEKRHALSHELKNILSLVEKMNRENTDAVMPLAHPLQVTQPFREDVVSEKNERTLFQKNAPQVESGLYIVPKFVESE